MATFELTMEVDGVVDFPDKELTLDDLSRLVVQWGLDRKIIQNGNPQTQCLKLMEEVGELASGIAKNDSDLIKDSIGDCIVVLLMIACQCDTSLHDCLRLAYEEIKDRRGFLNENGVFEKEQ